MQAAANPERTYRPTTPRDPAPLHAAKEYTLQVHLCSGAVLEVQRVTDVRVTQTQVLAMHRNHVLARFEREEVYFAGDRDQAPPMLF
jgi:hypothetical protein